jgi:hypothetical protein
MSPQSISNETLVADAAELESFIREDAESSRAQYRPSSWKERVNFPVLWLIILCLVCLNMLGIIIFLHWIPRTYDNGFKTDLSKFPSPSLLF